MTELLTVDGTQAALAERYSECADEHLRRAEAGAGPR